jgi:hypothetical protein
VPRDKLMKRVTQLAGLRELLDSKDPEGILIGYRAVLDLNPAITPAMVEKLLGSRCGNVGSGMDNGNPRAFVLLLLNLVVAHGRMAAVF